MPPEHPLDGVARFVAIVRGDSGRGATVARHRRRLLVAAAVLPQRRRAHVRNGWVSLVGAGRMAFAYPDFARDLMKHGRLNPQKVCVACSACTQIMRDGGRTGCVPRDAEIYEPIYKAGRAEALDTIPQMAATCRQCNDPTCVTGCPAQVNIPEFVGHIAAGRFREAYETLRERNVLAAVVRLRLPVGDAVRSRRASTSTTRRRVPIRHLQRWVSRKAVEEGWAAEPSELAPLTGKQVAVIGAGPAGISAAVNLARLGHSVTLFERVPIRAAWRRTPSPPNVCRMTSWRKRFARVWLPSATGSSGAMPTWATSSTLDDIMAEGFDAVLLAIGLSRTVALPGARRPAAGVTGALEFLARAKSGESVSGTVLVLGGGNTAIDAALAAKRAGASDVSIVYRRSFAEMPAWPAERDEAIRAGIHFLILTQPVDYEVDAEGRLVRPAGNPDSPGAARLRRPPQPGADPRHRTRSAG